jgi:STE24 endopeptidase
MFLNFNKRDGITLDASYKGTSTGRFFDGMEESLKRAKQYSNLKIRLTIIQLVLTVVFLLLFLLSGASTLLRNTVAAWSQSFYLQVALYLAMFSGIYYLLFAPLDFYDGFVLEHRFGLSTQTVFGWLKKNLKKVIVSLPILLVVAEALYFLLRHFPNSWWLLITAVWLLMTIVLGKIAPVLIIPLFYTCRPLPDSELRNKLLELGKKCSVRIKDVFEIQFSKETKKANAAVAGFGRGRRILLGDTLLDNYSKDQIEAVFAHELGHVRLLHTWRMLGFGAGTSLACFYITYLLFAKSVNLLGLDSIHDIAAFPLLIMIFVAAGLLLLPVQNGYSRYLEKQADRFALDHIADNKSFVSAITKLSSQNLSDPSPHSLVELLLYDHPPIAKRVAYCTSQANLSA